MHDPRVGRFFAIDPLSPKYPWNSSYAFSENVVIDHVELEGLEKANCNGNPDYSDYLPEKPSEEALKDPLVSYDYNKRLLDSGLNQDGSKAKGWSLEAVLEFTNDLSNRKPNQNSTPNNGGLSTNSNITLLSAMQYSLTTINVDLEAVKSLGGLEEAKKLIESGKFQVVYNNQLKTWSLDFYGNQSVNVEIVENAKKSFGEIAKKGTSALKVVKGVGLSVNFLSLGLTMYQGLDEINKTGSISVETGLDFTMGVVGFIPGVGTATGVAYMVLKPTVKFLHEAARESGAGFDNYGAASYDEMFELFLQGW